MSTNNQNEPRGGYDNAIYLRRVTVEKTLAATLPATAANWTGPLFIADDNYEVVDVLYRAGAAGTDAGAVSTKLTKVADGVAPGTSVDVATGFNLKGPANTLQVGTITSTKADRRLQRGDALYTPLTGVPTAVGDVCIMVVLKRITSGEF